MQKSGSMMNSVVEVRSVSRSFTPRGGSYALRDVSLTVEEGQVVALLGVNGAGKTTLTKIISTLLLPTAGQVTVLGNDVVTNPQNARRQMSVIFGGDKGLYNRLSGIENLRFFGMLAGVSRSEMKTRLLPMLEEVGLSEAGPKRVETYSKGMRQRLHIAIGLISRPRVLLLDEPTVGLDPDEAGKLRDTIARLRKDGVSVLLTSHYLLDVERLADRVVMLHAGRVKADMTIQDFAARAGYAAVLTIVIADSPTNISELPAGVTLDSIRQSFDGYEVVLRLLSWSPAILSAIGGAFATSNVLDMSVRQAGLEEAFASFAVAGGQE